MCSSDEDKCALQNKSCLRKSPGGNGQSNKINKTKNIYNLLLANVLNWLERSPIGVLHVFPHDFRNIRPTSSKKIEHKLQTCDLHKKGSISPAERLAVTLR